MENKSEPEDKKTKAVRRLLNLSPRQASHVLVAMDLVLAEESDTSGPFNPRANAFSFMYGALQTIAES